jgi:NAD(P)-dependent dehydrogenase (short-subunit alcohol dehydrogenase family)
LDVTDWDSVDAAADWLTKRYRRLDVLVNNAGVLPEATSELVEVVDRDMFGKTHADKVLSVVSVLQAMLPLLRRSRNGRIVNVSTT